MSSKPTLRSVRSAITTRQRDILDEVWQHIKRTHIGLPERPLLDKYGKAVLLDEVGKLGGTVIYSAHEENKVRYNLGVVGIFLASDGERLEKVVERYLVVLRDAYAKDKEIERFSSKDLASWAPDLTPDDLVALRHILYCAHDSLASRIGGWNPQEWFVTVDNEVVELKNVNDWKSYVNSKIMQWYDPRQPAGEIERMKYHLAKAKPNALLESLHQVDLEEVGGVLQPSGGNRSDATKASMQPSNTGQQPALHPWPIIRGFLMQLDSYDVPSVIDRAGLIVDWRVTEREDYSHKTRLAAYRPRIDEAYQALPTEQDRLRVAYIVTREASTRISLEDLNSALSEIGWEFRENRLLPVGETVRELFFGDRSQHDAYVEIRAILQRATKGIVIVDPYIDQSILTLLAACAKSGMSIRLLSSKLPADFALETRKWAAQHQGVAIEVRTTKEFHDRFIVLDDAACWHIGCSLKDAGQRAFMLSEIEDQNNRAALVAQLNKSWNTAAT